MEVPTTMSGRTPASDSARSMPTSCAPSSPPPPSTNAVVTYRRLTRAGDRAGTGLGNLGHAGDHLAPALTVCYASFAAFPRGAISCGTLPLTFTLINENMPHGNRSYTEYAPYWILQYFGAFTSARVTVKIHTSTAKTYQWLVTPGGSRLPPGQGCWVTRRLILISHASATDDRNLRRARPV
jgi:hypothetical protein